MHTTAELYALFERSPDAIFIEDFNGIVLDLNQRACELHGWSREQIIGKSVLELVPPEAREDVARDFPKWVSGELTELTSMSYDREGRKTWVELRGDHITFHGKPALMLSARDVSKRINVEKALAESEKRFRQMVEHTPEALMLVDISTGLLVEVNQNVEQLFGMRRAELLRVSPADLSPEFQPNGRRSDEMAMELIASAGFDRPIVFEWEHQHASGSPITCEVRLLKLESNGRMFVRGSISNITKQKQIQKRAEDLQHQLERARRMEAAGLLAGGVAHDLNNILGPMVGYPDLLIDQLPPGSDMGSLVEEIKSSAERAASIIQELLILARRGDVKRDALDLREAVSEYLGSCELKLIQNRNPNARILYSEEKDQEMVVLASKSHIIRLVMNLIINALQAMSGEGTIRVRTQRERLTEPLKGFEHVPSDDYVVLQVSDEGQGIAVDQLEQIFDPFYSSKKQSGTNSGLGLAVVYGIIRDHHAFIDVTSTVGKGTTFKIYFPAICASTLPAPRVEQCVYAASGHALVVDDVREQRELATQMLQRMGLTVTSVENGQRAVELVAREKFDVVLLDMVMEDDFDGLDTYLGIQECCPLLPCLIVSGYAESDRIQKALALGAGPHLHKPYTRSRLSEVLGPILGEVLAVKAS
jgi:PAS domain S-box-containing protein